MNALPVMPAIVLRPRMAAHYVGLSVATLDRKRKAGEFPQPVKLTRVSIGFRVKDLDEWVARRERTA